VTIGHTDRGKWSRSGVPHKGWICSGVEDLEEPSATCEMCESVEIRYVHHMEHPSYPEALGVGCVCAEHMEEDYTAPRAREKRLRAAARRRITWARRDWSTSFRGNLYLNTEGYNLSVFPVSGPKRGWKVVVAHRSSGAQQEGRQIYPSSDAAQKAGLNALLWAKDNLLKPRSS